MKTILIVEDEQPLREILTKELKKNNFEVVTAKDGVEGLELAGKHKPDMILLDIVMPRMDGMEMLKRLHEDPSMKKIPVFVLTNLSDPVSISKALQNQAYDYFVKSDLELPELMEKIKSKLGN